MKRRRTLLPWFINPEDVGLLNKIFFSLMVLFLFIAFIGLYCCWNVYSLLSEEELSNAELTNNQSSISFIPNIVMTAEPPKAFSYGFSLLILEPTKLFTYNTLASVYYLRNGVEHLVSFGRVINVQEDKLVQLLLFEDRDLQDILQRLLNDDKDVREKLIVKPTIDYSFLNEVLNYE